MTTVAIPVHPILWCLDYDNRLLGLMREIAGQIGAFEDVIGYNNPRDAATSVATAPLAGLPQVLVSDHVGFERTARYESVAETLRRVSPTSMILLHSNSAYDDPRTIPELHRRKLFDRDVPKTIFADEFAEVLTTWTERWKLVVPTRMRDYIRACPNPALEYFEDDESGSLSLFDIHRQIVAGTELGLEQEQVWGQLLCDASNHG